MTTAAVARATIGQLPVRAVLTVGAVAAGVVALAAREIKHPVELEGLLVASLVVLAAVAAAALDDPSEETTTATPVGRPHRWHLRLALTGAMTAVAMTVVVAVGSIAVPRHLAVPSTSWAFWGPGRMAAIGAGLVFTGWAVAAVAVRRLGPGAGTRIAVPLVLALYVLTEVTGSLLAALDQSRRHPDVGRAHRRLRCRVGRSDPRPGKPTRRKVPTVRPGLAERTDAELLELVADGSSRDALRELYERHLPWLRARLANRCADDAVVHDALQETFVAVWRTAGRYEGRGEVGAWLWGIAIRRLIDQLRRRPAMLQAFDGAEVDVSAEEAVLAGVEHGDLGGALGRLSPELRAVVQATVLDGLTTREAARLLGIPSGTVKTRMMRARREMRAQLA